MKLDEIDKILLQRLQEDAKVNVKELAAELNMTKTPIYERIKRYEREGVIQKYVAVLDHQKANNTSIVVFCTVLLESQKLDAIQKFSQSIAQIPEVIECYLMGGSSDFMLKVVVKDLNAYHLFSSMKLAALENVKQISSAFVLNEIKHSTILPVY